MEPRIQNGFLRAIIFMPMWFVTLTLVMTLSSLLIIAFSGNIGFLLQLCFFIIFLLAHFNKNRLLDFLSLVIFFAMIFSNMTYYENMANTVSTEALFSNMSFDSPVMLFLTASQILASFLALWFATKFIDRKPLMSIGLSVKDKANEMLVGLGFALAFIGGLFLVLWLLGAIALTGYVGFKPGVFIVSMMLFLAAFDEELIFRGYILNNMMDSSSRWVALAGSSALFALMHAGNPSVWSNWVPMTELFAAGFILGISYTFTKNLWFPTFFHFGWNFFQGLLGFEISGINVDSWKMISHENTGNIPGIISGGAFGIEGSVITLSCTIICTYFIYKYYNELNK